DWGVRNGFKMSAIFVVQGVNWVNQLADIFRHEIAAHAGACLRLTYRIPVAYQHDDLTIRGISRNLKRDAFNELRTIIFAGKSLNLNRFAALRFQFIHPQTRQCSRRTAVHRSYLYFNAADFHILKATVEQRGKRTFYAIRGKERGITRRSNSIIENEVRLPFN